MMNSGPTLTRPQMVTPIRSIGWTNRTPRMMHEEHLLIGKAGGATVQETIAAKCPDDHQPLSSRVRRKGNAQFHRRNEFRR
jgi:UDP-N-acetylglucosamine:LPS N-acetylglucosamine transferase